MFSYFIILIMCDIQKKFIKRYMSGINDCKLRQQHLSQETNVIYFYFLIRTCQYQIFNRTFQINTVSFFRQDYFIRIIHETLFFAPHLRG